MAHSSTETAPKVLENTQCHILRIPPELRLRIYDYYFGDEKTCMVEWGDEIIVKWQRDQAGTANDSGSSLLRTCKTICIEASPVLYATCTLSIDCDICACDYKDETKHTAKRELDNKDQCDFLASIRKADMVLCFDGGQSEIDRMQLVFETMDQGTHLKYLYIAIVATDPDPIVHFSAVIRLLQGLRCGGLVRIAFDPDPCFMPKTLRRAMLKAAKA